MTRDELLELLTVERYAPGPARPRMSGSSRLDVPVDDDVTIARRRRDLVHAAERYIDPDIARRATRARARAARLARQKRSA